VSVVNLSLVTDKMLYADDERSQHQRQQPQHHSQITLSRHTLMSSIKQTNKLYTVAQKLGQYKSTRCHVTVGRNSWNVDWLSTFIELRSKFVTVINEQPISEVF